MISGRKDCRSGALRCAPMSEAEAFYCQGNHAEATRNELAETMDVNPSTLGNWLDPHHTSRIPDDRKAQLLRLTDDHGAYVRFLAEQQGLVVFDPRRAGGKGVTRMVSEFSDVLRAFDEARQDGTMTPEEARRFRREVNELHGAVENEVRQAFTDAGIASELQS